MANLTIDAGEGRIRRRIADQAEILEAIERVGEDVIIESSKTRIFIMNAFAFETAGLIGNDITLHNRLWTV
jgi:hypothetical protein